MLFSKSIYVLNIAFSYKKPTKESMQTDNYWKQFAADQEMIISLHCGVADLPGGKERGQKQRRGILSRLCAQGDKKKPQKQEQVGLLEDVDALDEERAHWNKKIVPTTAELKVWKLKV